MDRYKVGNKLATEVLFENLLLGDCTDIMKTIKYHIMLCLPPGATHRYHLLFLLKVYILLDIFPIKNKTHRYILQNTRLTIRKIPYLKYYNDVVTQLWTFLLH